MLIFLNKLSNHSFFFKVLWVKKKKRQPDSPDLDLKLIANTTKMTSKIINLAHDDHVLHDYINVAVGDHVPNSTYLYL